MIGRLLVVLVAAVATVLPALPASAGGFCSEADAFQDRATDEVVMKNDCFGPTVARVEAGDEVVFRNLDSHDHAVAGVAGTFGDPHKPVPAGSEIGFRFEDEGVYPFHCTFHPGMGGAIVVGDGGASSSGAVVVPVDPAAASAEKPSPVQGGGVPVAMYVVIAAIALGLAAVTTLALRRRRALGTT